MTRDFGRNAEERSRGWFVYMSVRSVLYLDFDNVFCDSPTRIGTFEEPSRFDEAILGTPVASATYRRRMGAGGPFPSGLDRGPFSVHIGPAPLGTRRVS